MPETAAGPDYWYARFHEYMTPEQRARYLATPPDERFRRFGEQILEWERRRFAEERAPKPAPRTP